MNIGPTISIITVVKDDAQSLLETKSSILDQSISADKLNHIIVESFPVGNVGFSKLHSNSDPLHSESHYLLNDTGIYMAMNFGLSKAKGDFILFLNAGDTFFSSDSLAHLFSYFSGANFEISRFNYHFPFHYDLFSKGQSISNYDILGFTDLPKALRSGMLICQQSILFRRRDLIHCGGFDQSYKLAGDYDLVCRMILLNSTFKTIPYLLVSYQSGGVSETSHRESAKEIQNARSFYSKIFY